MDQITTARSADQVVLEQLQSINRALTIENSTLRSQIHALQQTAADAEALRRIVELISIEKQSVESRLGNLSRELSETAREREHLEARLRELEAEAAHYSSLYVDAEQQNNNLSTLYVASHHLHASLRQEDVLARIQEIIVNLVGCEELAIFEYDAARDALDLVAACGIDEQRWRSVPARAGCIGVAFSRGEVYISEAQRGAAEQHLTACIPLKIADRTIGAIALFRLLAHKPALVPLDRELFEMLSVHGGVAFYSASLHEKASRGLM